MIVVDKPPNFTYTVFKHLFCKMYCLFLIVKMVVNKEKALVGAFRGHCETSQSPYDTSSV